MTAMVGGSRHQTSKTIAKKFLGLPSRSGAVERPWIKSSKERGHRGTSC
jgi:hypothetical protein